MSLLIGPCLLLAFGPPPSAADMHGLIQQLGSRRFQEREAASKALDRLGEPALEELRKAANRDADAEVRRRAGALVERMEWRRTLLLAKGIIGSDHASREKGRRLQRFIRHEMWRQEVISAIGRPQGGTVGDERLDYYLRYGLCVVYDRGRRVKKVCPGPTGTQDGE